MNTLQKCWWMSFGAWLACAGCASVADEESPTGYTDTPRLPGSEWRVHDDRRPRPPAVRPGKDPGAPPADAVILFDGKDLSAWQTEKGGAAGWKVEGGYMEVVGGSGDIVTRQRFGDSQLHLEFRSPLPASGHSQQRGNSGVFLSGLYEIQVLDSFDNVSYADGQASAIYGQSPPLVNASRPPGEWQSYDIIYSVPRFEHGRLSIPGHVTVLHNGVLTQNHTRLLGDTAYRALPQATPHPLDGPIKLQDHGSAVRFRNIWIRPLDRTAHP